MDINTMNTLNPLDAVTTNNTTRSNSLPNQQISSDMFYKLLAAQLQYQDPMESMDNTQMILQMAQFATIEQLNNLNYQFNSFMEMSTIQDGAALVGKEVRVGIDEDETIVGTVDKVGFSSAGILLEVDGKYYEVWRIIEIGEPGSLETETKPPEGGGEGETGGEGNTGGTEEVGKL